MNTPKIWLLCVTLLFAGIGTAQLAVPGGSDRTKQAASGLSSHPTATTASQPAGKAFASLEVVIAAMPAKVLPAKGQRWNALLISKCNDWLKNNVDGHQVQFKVRVLEVGAPTPDRYTGAKDDVFLNCGYAAFKVITPPQRTQIVGPNGLKTITFPGTNDLFVFDGKGVEWEARGITAAFGKDWKDRLSRLKESTSSEWEHQGDAITVTGTVHAIKVSELEVRRTLPRAGISIEIRDCTFVK